MSEELAPRPVTKITRERAAELLARSDQRNKVENYAQLMLGALLTGLIEAGEDPRGGLHWRITPKGIRAHGILTDILDPAAGDPEAAHDAEFGGPELRAAQKFERDNPA